MSPARSAKVVHRARRDECYYITCRSDGKASEALRLPRKRRAGGVQWSLLERSNRCRHSQEQFITSAGNRNYHAVPLSRADRDVSGFERHHPMKDIYKYRKVSAIFPILQSKPKYCLLIVSQPSSRRERCCRFGYRQVFGRRSALTPPLQWEPHPRRRKSPESLQS